METSAAALAPKFTPADVRHAFGLADWWRSTLRAAMAINLAALAVPLLAGPLTLWLALMIASVGCFLIGRWRWDVWHKRAMDALDHIPPVDALAILEERIKRP